MAADTTKCKIIVGLTPTDAGNPAVLNDPPLYGGFSLIDLTAVASGTAADVLVYVGTDISIGASSLTTTTSTIANDNSVSFISTGWRGGDQCVMFSPEVSAFLPVANDGIVGIVTGVTTTTLTLSGTPLTALSMNPGTKLYKISQLFRKSVTASAGYGTAASELLMGGATDSSAVRGDRKFGADQILIAAMSTTLGGGIVQSVNAQYGRY